jgi:hypothetical protein
VGLKDMVIVWVPRTDLEANKYRSAARYSFSKGMAEYGNELRFWCKIKA